MKKTIYHFTIATLGFCVFMQIVFAIYTGVTGVEIAEHGWLNIIDSIINILYIISALTFGVFLSMAVHRYVNMPEPRITIPHAKAEVSWTDVERDPEGEEISRSSHSIQFCHTMNDEQLNDVIEMWHRYRRNYEINARSSQDCVDFINMFTPHYAALTEEELLTRLKNK